MRRQEREEFRGGSFIYVCRWPFVIKGPWQSLLLCPHSELQHGMLLTSGLLSLDASEMPRAQAWEASKGWFMLKCSSHLQANACISEEDFKQPTDVVAFILREVSLLVTSIKWLGQLNSNFLGGLEIPALISPPHGLNMHWAQSSRGGLRQAVWLSPTPSEEFISLMGSEVSESVPHQRKRETTGFSPLVPHLTFLLFFS